MTVLVLQGRSPLSLATQANGVIMNQLLFLGAEPVARNTKVSALLQVFVLLVCHESYQV